MEKNKISHQDPPKYKIAVKEVIKTQKCTPINVIILNDSRIASNFDDASIKIYNNLTYKTDITIDSGFKDEKMTICQLSKNNYLIAGGADCIWGDIILKLWELERYTASFLFSVRDAHQKRIWKIINFGEDKFMTCGGDETFKIWKNNYDSNNKKPNNIPIVVKKLHSGDVSNLYLLTSKEDVLVSTGSMDGLIDFWDISKIKNIRLISRLDVPMVEQNYIHEIDSQQLLYVSFNQIVIINLDNYMASATISGNNLYFVPSVCCLAEGIFLMGTKNGNLVEFTSGDDSFSLPTLICEKESSYNNITFLVKYGDNTLIAGIENCEIRIITIDKKSIDD